MEKHYIYRLKDGLYEEDYYPGYDRNKPYDCYTSAIKPWLGYDPSEEWMDVDPEILANRDPR